MVYLKIMSNTNIDNRIKKYKNITTINPYIESFYEYKNQDFKSIKKLSYNDKSYTISYLTNKEMIISSLDVGYNLPEDELEGYFFDKAYEELGLDEEKEYVINYQKRDDDRDSFVYNLFISEPSKVDAYFSTVLDETKYIDLLIPAPLLFKTLYTNKILENRDAHCYVYFTVKDAFVAMYNNGNFIYSKSLEFSLEQIYDKYCALVGEKIDKKEFFDVLNSEGLKTSNAEYQQNLMKIFGEIFLQINDIVIYARRAYNIDSIQKLFLGSVDSPVIGLSDYGYNYLGIPTFNLDFNFDIKNDEWYVDQLQYLMVKSGLDYINDPKKTLNLSTYPRAPIFAKRASGQFIISFIISSLLALGLPLVYLIPAYSLEAYNLKLSNDDRVLNTDVVKYKGILENKKKIISSSKTELKRLEAIFEKKARTLTAIYDKKVNYKFKSNFLYIFSKDLAKFNVNIEEIFSTDDKFTFHLLSKDEKNITKYIKYVSKKYFNDIQVIDIKRIELDTDELVYRGVLKVDYK
ncbi:MAG: FIG00470756: hypothetical protein [uncultured Sulfurovum sp.]|uniref:Uncharacterized protein n=1 Tax=uncultured Sulfurovum sp. TaxID=269237 RepID=A0A6S6U841_9BACT|nr:MAG: FIG00470756: hypothetical protein [uncultured Sulfurovum sp.]